MHQVSYSCGGENHVIYWTSENPSTSNHSAFLTTAGALQLRDESLKPVWSVFGEGHNDSVNYRYLRLDVDGNLRLYSWIAAPLCDIVLVLEGVLLLVGNNLFSKVFPYRRVLGVKALRVGMDSPLHLSVCHHVINPMIHAALGTLEQFGDRKTKWGFFRIGGFRRKPS